MKVVLPSHEVTSSGSEGLGASFVYGNQPIVNALNGMFGSRVQLDAIKPRFGSFDQYACV